tara:strand:- start:71 stop:421 length:351 start_codon:yes stop_codon:yes gene_type:complete
MSKQYSMFIGRWQPWHDGHRWLIDQRLNEGKNVLICIRDVEPNKDQPWTADEVMLNLSKELNDILDKVKIIKIPDIESINYGRGVGYEVIEHIPPQDVKEISATKIRAKMREDGKL